MRNKLTIRYVVAIFAMMAALHSCGPDDKPESESAPAVPSGLTLHDATETTLAFQWDAVSGADSYAWKLVQGASTVKEGTSSSRNAVISGLTAGTAYRFAVSALKGGLQSAFTAYLDASTKTAVTPEPDPDPVDPQPGTDQYEEFKIPAWEEDGVARAFPGAEGGGMYCAGGRGGDVYHVKNLNDSGENSLRWALGKSGKRTIVFDVAGIIELNSTLDIKNGQVTIAGQTAPGDGICIKNFATRINTGDDKAASGKDGDVIIRFIRFRMGDEKKTEDDAIWGRRNRNIILDHCSMSWSTDECASFYGNENFTMQWCILSESLTNSVHGKGSHGYGGIWGGKNASFHHNLLAHHNNRTPRFDHPNVYEDPASPAMRGHVDHRNNVIYNWGSGSGCYGGNNGYFNMVGNYYKPGPASVDRHFFIEADGVYKSGSSYIRYEYPYLYLSGNKHTQHADITSSNASGVYWKVESGYFGEAVSKDGHVVDKPHAISGKGGAKAYTTTFSADQAYERVLAYAGASLRQDAVDKRAVADTRSGKATIPAGSNGSKGGLIDTQTDAGGWPSYKATEAELARILDTDGDGMPDWFEEQFGLDKAKPADGKVITLDKHGRYTNLEMYLHYLVRDIVAAQADGGEYTEL